MWWSVAIFVAIIVLGIPYIIGSMPTKNHYTRNNKRDYVIQNLDKFRIKDKGSSLKKKNVYLVSRDELGIWICNYSVRILTIVKECKFFNCASSKCWDDKEVKNEETYKKVCSYGNRNQSFGDSVWNNS